MPTQSREARKVRVIGMDFGLELHGQSSDVRIGDKVSAGSCLSQCSR